MTKLNIKNVKYKKEQIRGDYCVDTSGYITLPELLRACTRMDTNFNAYDVEIPTYKDKTDALREVQDLNTFIKEKQGVLNEQLKSKSRDSGRDSGKTDGISKDSTDSTGK